MVAPVFGGHSDMFGCRSSACPVVEMTDQNWEKNLAKSPTFVMFYAPWCGHCKALAPKLKKAGKELAGTIAVGALDVEPNGRVQSMFPDIRGFPTLKFVKSNGASVDYDGPREASDIVAWSQQQAEKAGVVVVPSKTFSELYSYLGRAALDGVSRGLLLIGQDKEAPSWFSKVLNDLAEVDEETKGHLLEAKRTAKHKDVAAAVDDALAAVDEKKTSVYQHAYCSDAETRDAFGGNGLVVIYLDRKNLWKSTYAMKAASNKASENAAWIKSVEGGSSSVPEFPKPASVLAAEARRKPKVNVVDSPETLESYCYSKANCVLFVGDGGDETLAAKYKDSNFDFVKIAKDSPPARALLGEFFSEVDSPSACVVVKTGKRPRAVRSPVSKCESLLEDITGGGAKFVPFRNKLLPAWTIDEGDYDYEEEL